MANEIKINDVHVNLEEVVKFDNIDELKKMEIFSSDEHYKTVWDAAQKLKSKAVEPLKVEMKKVKK